MKLLASVSRILSAVLLILLMQGPGTLMQEIAWAKMLVAYTRDRGLARGVVETFDGRHPCKLCAKARQLREDERRQAPAEPGREGKRMQRLAWADMLPQGCSVVPVPQGLALGAIPLPEVNALTGLDRAAPVSPPPEA